MQTKSWGAAALVGAIVAAGAATGSGGVAAASAPPVSSECAGPLAEPVELTVGTLPSANAAAIYIADGMGYFADENISVEVINSGTSAETQPLLATGRIDAMYGGASAGYFNGVSGGQEVRVVAGAGQAPEGGPAAAYVVLGDSELHEVADLKGQKIAVPGGLAGTSAFYLYILLGQADLTVDDVEIVTLSNADGIAALENGSVAAAMSNGPVLTQGLADGSQRLIGNADLVTVGGNTGGILFGPNLLTENRCAGVAFLRGLLRAVDNHLSVDGWLEDPEVVQIIADATGFPTDVIEEQIPPVFAPGLPVPANSWLAAQGFWLDQGQLQYEEALPESAIFDLDLIAEAAATLPG